MLCILYMKGNEKTVETQNNRLPGVDTYIAVALNAAFKVALNHDRGKYNLTCPEIITKLFVQQ